MNRQGAPLGHRVTRIDGQVHQHLFDHAVVAPDQGNLGWRVEMQGNCLTQQAPDHLAHVPDHFPQVQLLDLHDVLAAEDQQLAGQIRRAFGGIKNRLGGVQQARRQGSLGHQHPRMALDDGEHIVEIVRHSGCQLAHRLHLLSLAQLRLQAKPARDVLDIAMHRLALGHRVKRPRQGASLNPRLMPRQAQTRGQAIPDPARGCPPAADPWDAFAQWRPPVCAPPRSNR